MEIVKRNQDLSFDFITSVKEGAETFYFCMHTCLMEITMSL